MRSLQQKRIKHHHGTLGFIATGEPYNRYLNNIPSFLSNHLIPLSQSQPPQPLTSVIGYANGIITHTTGTRLAYYSWGTSPKSPGKSPWRSNRGKCLIRKRCWWRLSVCGQGVGGYAEAYNISITVIKVWTHKTLWQAGWGGFHLYSVQTFSIRIGAAGWMVWCGVVRIRRNPRVPFRNRKYIAGPLFRGRRIFMIGLLMLW